MNKIIVKKILAVCDQKIEQKGTNVGLSFMHFLQTKTITLNYLWK